MIQWLFYQQPYFWNLIFWNSQPSKHFQWILLTEQLQIFFMTAILHHVKSYLGTEAVLRITYSFLLLFRLVFYHKSFAFPTLPCFPGLIPAIKWQCILWIPLARSSAPQLLWLWLWQHTAPFPGAVLMRGLSVFLTKSPQSHRSSSFGWCVSSVLSLLLCLLSADLFPFCSHYLTQPSVHWPHFPSDSSLSTLSCVLGLGLVFGVFLCIYQYKCFSPLPFHCNIFSDSSTNLFVNSCFLFFPLSQHFPHFPPRNFSPTEKFQLLVALSKLWFR